ncbi:MAG TPA: cytochrome ubiquinol oxidase subunit I, partial [Candidatus Saccharimonadales bacterium]
MEHLNAGRVLMADSLGFHIIFALLGVGLPLCMLFVEWLAIRRKSNPMRESARLWSYVVSVLVIGGVLSGSVVALQMFLIWPGILQFGGHAIGFAFMLEGYMFIIEAVFLALYVKTWKSIQGYKHLLLGVPVLLGATG